MMKKIVSSMFRKAEEPPKPDPSRRIFGALDSIVWSGSPPPESRVNKVVTKAIDDMWEEGILPYQINEKHWIVSFNVYHSFMSNSVSPIIAGPKKPRRRKYREKIRVGGVY